MLLSLRVSLAAVVFASLIGLPAGALVAVARFRGRRPLIVVLNALMGLPSVVVGLVVYLLLSRAGPLGALGHPVHADGDGDRADDPDHADDGGACRARSSRTAGTSTASSCARSAPAASASR